jgi:hypothetical protein
VNDATLLLWIGRGKILAGFLVAIGVAGEFLGDFIENPLIKRRDDAQQAQIAQLGKDAAEANARAAEANRVAEEEKLARLKLEAKIAPRRLTLAQIAKLAELLKPFGGSSLSMDVTAASGLEGTNLADDMLVALNNAHITAQGNQRLMDLFFGNVILKAGKTRTKEANIIANFLIEIGLSPTPAQVEPSQDDNELRIRIGSKP